MQVPYIFVQFVQKMLKIECDVHRWHFRGDVLSLWWQNTQPMCLLLWCLWSQHFKAKFLKILWLSKESVRAFHRFAFKLVWAIILENIYLGLSHSCLCKAVHGAVVLWSYIFNEIYRNPFLLDTQKFLKQTCTKPVSVFSVVYLMRLKHIPSFPRRHVEK